MPSWQTLFKNENFIAGIELLEGNKKPTLTITRINSVKMEDEDGKMKDKAVIFFKEIKRGWVFCKTTGFCLAAMFGDDIDKWTGKRVTLHGELVQVGGEKKPGIRVTGSPDIDKDVSVRIKFFKKKAFVLKLIKTTPKGGHELKDPPPPTEPETPPAEEPSTQQQEGA
jgi:hypothetical protein